MQFSTVEIEHKHDAIAHLPVHVHVYIQYMFSNAIIISKFPWSFVDG